MISKRILRCDQGVLVMVGGYAGFRIGRERRPGQHRGMTSGRARIEDLIAQLEQQRSRLEDVRKRAREQGGPEGKRLEEQAEARLRDIDRRINALRKAL
jgi:hypothetical protein